MLPFVTMDLAARHRELLLGEFASTRTQAAAAVALFEEGATLPFIARYRKERTGGLTETQLKRIKDRLDFHAALRDRKATVLDSIREQGALTPDLERRIVDCVDKQRLEDLYLPFKPKRRTRASIAREKGLQPLADLILQQARTGDSLEALAAPYIGEAVPNGEDAWAGAKDIVAETLSDHPEVRRITRAEIEGRFTGFDLHIAADHDDRFETRVLVVLAAIRAAGGKLHATHLQAPTGNAGSEMLD